METRYPLDDHANMVLGIGLRFFEPMVDDIPTDPEHARKTSNIESEDEAENEPPLHVHRAPQLPEPDMEE